MARLRLRQQRQLRQTSTQSRDCRKNRNCRCRKSSKHKTDSIEASLEAIEKPLGDKDPIVSPREWYSDFHRFHERLVLRARFRLPASQGDRSVALRAD